MQGRGDEIYAYANQKPAPLPSRPTGCRRWQKLPEPGGAGGFVQLSFSFLLSPSDRWGFLCAIRSLT